MEEEEEEEERNLGMRRELFTLQELQWQELTLLTGQRSLGKEPLSLPSYLMPLARLQVADMLNRETTNGSRSTMARAYIINRGSNQLGKGSPLFPLLPYALSTREGY